MHVYNVYVCKHQSPVTHRILHVYGKKTLICMHVNGHNYYTYCLRSFLLSSPHLLVRSRFILSAVAPGNLISQYSIIGMTHNNYYYKFFMIILTINLLNTAVLIVWLMPDVAEQAASLSLLYQILIKALISPVAVLLLHCSACSKSTNATYTPNPSTNCFFYISKKNLNDLLRLKLMYCIPLHQVRMPFAPILGPLPSPHTCIFLMSIWVNQ